GSLALPRILPITRGFHPLLIYAGIEALIAFFGVIELLLIPLIGTAYLAGPQSGLPGMLWRGAFASICLLPPTILMGASLPAIVRWVESGPRGVSWWGLLYGANTAGAVFGALIAGFYLLRVYDVNIATFAAAAINLVIAAASFVVAWWTPRLAAALGAQVVWTRLMGLTFGATVYAFSIILAVFLAGLALGTALASMLARE